MLTRKPRKGETVYWPDSKDQTRYTVVSLDGNLCWIKNPHSGVVAPFIWNFRDGMNNQATIEGTEKSAAL